MNAEDNPARSHPAYLTAELVFANVMLPKNKFNDVRVAHIGHDEVLLSYKKEKFQKEAEVLLAMLSGAFCIVEVYDTHIWILVDTFNWEPKIVQRALDQLPHENMSLYQFRASDFTKPRTKEMFHANTKILSAGSTGLEHGGSQS